MGAIIIVVLVVIAIIIFISIDRRSNHYNDRTNSTPQETYDNLSEKLEELRHQNLEWHNLHDPIVDRNNKGRDLEKSGQHEEAIKVYEENVQYILNNWEKFISNYPAPYSFTRLMILYRKHYSTDKEIDFIKLAIERYSQFGEDSGLLNDWTDRLNKLTTTKKKKPVLCNRDDINWPIRPEITIGVRLEEAKHKLTPFDFYENKPADMDTGMYIFNNPDHFDRNTVFNYANILDQLNLIIGNGKEAENKGDFKSAIEFYEKAIIEESLNRTPYERLLVLYRKLNWPEDERRILENGISFFEKAREDQRKYLLSIANTDFKKSKTLEYINAGKKIYYYMGSLELYNPYPVIEKWKARLEKINK